jgi:hypothetical protein
LPFEVLCFCNLFIANYCVYEYPTTYIYFIYVWLSCLRSFFQILFVKSGDKYPNILLPKRLFVIKNY